MNVLIAVGTSILYLASGGSGGQSASTIGSVAAIAMVGGGVENALPHTTIGEERDRLSLVDEVQPVRSYFHAIGKYFPAKELTVGGGLGLLFKKATGTDEKFELHGLQAILKEYEYKCDHNSKNPVKIRLVDLQVKNGDTWRLKKACWNDTTKRLEIVATHDPVEFKPEPSTDEPGPPPPPDKVSPVVVNPDDPVRPDPISGTITVILDPIDDMHPTIIQISCNYMP